jgi:DNA polymerase bacteriophage-type
MTLLSSSSLLAPQPTQSPPGAGEAIAVLRDCGWPTDVVILDWETYFDAKYSLTEMSTIEYIEHDKFEEQGVACLVIHGDLPAAPRQATFWPNVKEQVSWLQSRYGQNLESATVVAQNVRFDGSILVRKHGIIPPYVVDIVALSRHLDARNTHNLKALCERHHLPPKGDTLLFQGKRWELMIEEERIAYAAYACNDAEREADLFCILLPKLTRPEIELPLQRHTLRLYWEPELMFDFAEADRLKELMEAQVTQGCGSHTLKEIRGNKSFIALLGTALAETGEVVAMKAGKKKMIAALAKDDAAIKAYRIHRNPRVRELIQARQAVKSWPLHLKRLGSMATQARAAGGRLPNPLTYYGAHTGRWSGGEGINTCNLPTRGSGLATEMKHCLVAPEGHVLIMADAAQIEARGLAWLAGQEDLVAAFERDEDIYSSFAAETLAAPCRKPLKSDPPPVAKVYSGRRALGKVGILGMGYGMGAVRALDYMMSYPELASKVESGEIDLTFCKRFVDSYRQNYPMIPKLWRDLEATFKYVTRYGKEASLRGLTLSREGTTTILRLPCGRSLFFPCAAVSFDDRLRFQWGDLWGGTLTENVVQAMSRDVLAEAILFVEGHGFRVAHHVYDSIVVSVEEPMQTLAFACVSEALKRRPTWAPDWPLSVETTVGRRYE